MKKIYSFFAIFIFILSFSFLNFKNEKLNNNYSPKKQVVTKKKIVMGSFYSSILIENSFNNTNTLYMWGNNDFGQLGVGSFDSQWSPVPIDVNDNGIIGDEKIIDFSLGASHSSAIVDNNNGTQSLFMWGSNGYGQLGDGTKTDRNKPVKIDIDGNGIKGDEKILFVELGTSFSSVVIENNDGSNSLYMWGRNNFGQLGLGKTDDVILKPSEVNISGTSGDEKILGVSLGSYHSSLVIENKSDGTSSLYTWGLNNKGQLGLGSTSLSYSTPKLIDIDSDSTLGHEKIKAFEMGDNFSSAVLEKDSNGDAIYMWGDNSYGQLGLGGKVDESYPTLLDIDGNTNPYDQKITDISLGVRNTIFLLEEQNDFNSIYITGNNQFGQLGNGSYSSNDQLKPIGIDVNNSGSFVDETITDISLGAYHSSVLYGEDELWIWGDNRFGQLGDNTNQNKNLPFVVDLGLSFLFDVVSKNQNSFSFEFSSNINIDESDKYNIKIVDNDGNNYSSTYDGTSKYTVTGLESGKNYFFESIIINGISYDISNRLNVLTDYEIKGISNSTSTSTTAEIYFDINATSFGSFNEDQRTIKIDYIYTPIGGKKANKDSTNNLIIDKNGKLNFIELEPGSTYEITNVSYNYVQSSGSFLYSESITSNNVIVTSLEGLYLLNNTFNLKSIGQTSFKFKIYLSDSGNDFFKYDYVYLFFKNVKGGESPILAYKQNNNQFGSGEYEFYVKNLSSDTKYEFVGISIDRVMSINDQGLEERFEESITLRTKPTYKTVYFSLFIILILIVILILLFLFFMYKSAATYREMHEAIEKWNNHHDYY